MPSLPSVPPFFSLVSLRTIGGVALAVPVAAIIIVGVVIAVASVMENVRFSDATRQIHDLTKGAREFAEREAHFATQTGDNLIPALAHAGLVPGTSTTEEVTKLTNPWGGEVLLVAAAPSVVRLETYVPVRNCRRLALFFGQDPAAFRILAMDAREGGAGFWRRFYVTHTSAGLASIDERQVQAGCGQLSQASLAFVIQVR